MGKIVVKAADRDNRFDPFAVALILNYLCLFFMEFWGYDWFTVAAHLRSQSVLRLWELYSFWHEVNQCDDSGDVPVLKWRKGAIKSGFSRLWLKIYLVLFFESWQNHLSVLLVTFLPTPPLTECVCLRRWRCGSKTAEPNRRRTPPRIQTSAPPPRLSLWPPATSCAS